MSYATPDDLIEFVDERIIADLITDNNIRPNQAAVLTDPNVILALSTASGVINSSILVAQKYTVAQLQALTGDDQNLLTMMTCWLAFGQLCMRRGRDPETQPAYKQVMESIERVKVGQNIFNVPSSVNSQLPVEMFMSANQWQAVNSVRSATFRYFPTRRIQQTTGG